MRKRLSIRAGSVVQVLRALTALTHDLGWALSIHTRWFTTSCDSTCLWAPTCPCTYQRQRDHTRVHASHDHHQSLPPTALPWASVSEMSTKHLGQIWRQGEIDSYICLYKVNIGNYIISTLLGWDKTLRYLQ